MHLWVYTTTWKEQDLEVEVRYTKDTLGFNQQKRVYHGGEFKYTGRTFLDPNHTGKSDPEYIKQYHQEHILGLMDKVQEACCD